MAKNYIKEVAQMLGVELGEEFEIKSEYFNNKNRYRFVDTGFEKVRVENEGYLFDDHEVLNVFNMLLSGMIVPIPCPKELKYGEAYYFIKTNGNVGCVTWYNSAQDLALLHTGNCFLSMADAEAAKEKIIANMNDVANREKVQR